MIDYLVNIFETNEFAQGMMIAGPTTAALYLLREIPVKLYRAGQRAVTYTLTFRSDTDEYYFVSKYISDNIVSKRWARKFAYDSDTIWDDEIQENISTVNGLTLGYGTHLGWFNNHPVLVERTLEENDQTNQFKERMTLRFFGRTKGLVESFVSEVQDNLKVISETTTVAVRVNTGGGWRHAPKLFKRSLHSVFVPEGQDLVDKIANFTQSREDYSRKGLPYHMGIMLTGPPGTGKTSLIHAIASETGREIAFLNLSAVQSDSELMELMSHNMNWERMILVLEDIDVSRVSVDRENKSKSVALSSLLNMLDGILTPDGLVTIATTNHPDRLDPALTRAGRFDHVVHVDKLKWDQFKDMAKLLREDYHQFMALQPIYVPMEGAILREWLIHQDFNFIKDKFLS